MDAFLDYSQFLDQDKEEFARCVRVLLNQTFVLEKKYDKRQEALTDTKEYYFIDRYFTMFQAYFMMMGYDLERYDREGVIYLITNGRHLVRLKEDTTKILLVIKLLYEEKMRTITYDPTVYISFLEVKQKVDVFHLIDKSLSNSALISIFKELAKYQLIDFKATDFDENSKIIVYPSIRYLLMNKDVQEILNQWKGEEHESTQEDAVN